MLMQVYAVALFVEAEPAAHELGVRHRGGFFQDNRCGLDYLCLHVIVHVSTLCLCPGFAASHPLCSSSCCIISSVLLHLNS